MEIPFVINTLFLLICGAMVMFMAAGFAMLEAGMVRSKSVGVILVKNISLYAIASLMFYLVGYNLMYLGVDGGLFGTPSLWHPDDSAALAGDYSAGYASPAGWFFQMVFVATAASIVSGALAERIKIWPFLAFVVILTGFIYPITGSWVWGEGWLSTLGFKDFAGSTLVHSVGGWAALAGALLLGARRGRFDSADGKPKALAGSSLPQVTIGTFILWFGWFGFNGGSQLAIASTEDALAVAKIFANTNMAAAAGAITALALSQALYKKIDVPMVLNGALAGLVAITAGPLLPSLALAIYIGAVGGVVMFVATLLLDKFKIDDVVGAIPVHLASGIWGTLAVALTDPEASFAVQALGVFAVGLFVFTLSFGIWFAMKMAIGIRLHWSQEKLGGDMSELGVRAYNLDFEDNTPLKA
ncbi:MAG: ammonium transporter [Pseudomonadota bacterium]|jgi:Amt family ammonium transporter|nr:ammonium transporter [Pseudomonadota bacterium]MED5423383.1 ammonium transporter [Pseudomonadota bacterium]